MSAAARSGRSGADVAAVATGCGGAAAAGAGGGTGRGGGGAVPGGAPSLLESNGRRGAPEPSFLTPAMDEPSGPSVDSGGSAVSILTPRPRRGKPPPGPARKARDPCPDERLRTYSASDGRLVVLPWGLR